jgi:hypothetical protein
MLDYSDKLLKELEQHLLLMEKLVIKPSLLKIEPYEEEIIFA